jgi:plastocyanin
MRTVSGRLLECGAVPDLRLTPKRWPAKVLLVVGLVGALGACSGDDDDSASDTTAPAAPDTVATSAAADSTAAPAAPAAGATVTIADFKFDPSPASVAAGQALEFTNTDSTTHQIASTTSDLLVSDPLAQGDQFTVTFDTPGTYDYFCGIHSSMTGTIEVTA